MKTIHDIDISGKRVLVRVDFNVPLVNGKVSDETRIKQALPTIEYLLKNKAKVVLLSHLGRPKGQAVEGLKLDPIAVRLSELLKKKVAKADDCVGDSAKKIIKNLKEGEVVLLENTRFYSEEKENNLEFAKKLANFGDVFVQEAFGAIHRAHASTVGIAKFLPTVAGLLVEKEVMELEKVFQNPSKPLVFIVGGAKIDTKLGILKKFSEIADTILVGGGLANTFLAAEGYSIGESLYEEDKLELAQDILMTASAAGCKFVLPNDVICADAEVELSEKTPVLDLRADAVPFNLKILDIGKRTQRQYAEIIKKAGTVIWNGPLGLFEMTPFSSGTKAVANACAENSATTILGGGDTLEALKRFQISPEKFTHISTGGGAMLEFLEGKKLPGLEAIK